MNERIVITGLGAVTPLGLTAEESWQNAVRGVSGVAPITLFDTSDWYVKIACEVKNFDPANYMPVKEARRMDRFEQFSIAIAQEAVRNAGLQVTPENAERIGMILSSAIGGLASLENGVYLLQNQGFRRVSPFTIPMMMPNGGAGLAAIDLGVKGPCFSVASACASGADGIGTAWMMLNSGMVDAVITGAAESTVCAIGVGAFDRMGAMTRRTDLVPQPFDKERDGLVMGEGGAALVLERESFARARGANIICELAGYAATADAHHITAPAENGEGGARAMRLALQTAGINPNEVNYINAHGTSTPLNDAAETQAIKAAFGEYAYHIPISSTKSMTGHMMGATGAVEAMFCAQAIRDGILPPTINYRTPDPACDLDYIPNEARRANVRVALSNSFGFGGHNAVLVFKQYEG
ncbi:MAG: beta-ketoacyl-ACP synthase II [Anaerolineales bacterium]